MEQPDSMFNVSVLWRGTKYTVEISSESSLSDLGHKLLKLTEVKADTMRLIVPQFSGKGSKMLHPFSDEDGYLHLQDISIFVDKPIRMMGVSKDEVDEVLQNAKKNERIAGFEEEEKRIKQRVSKKPHASLRLPEGPYIFCEFRTLQLPGIELNPPAPEALKRMHMLAADPGIVAIMNKYRWRVGIMTEMAPVGYVGVSPKCILGFNKNHGEEISLRLRTDDLKGFRKYEVIKKTLLHELAHMVYSEHDANFYALDKQLNEEATTLDWTRSKGYTLNGVGHSQQYEERYDDQEDDINFSQKLGGSMLHQLYSARTSSVAAAYHRSTQPSSFSSVVSKVSEEPDPDDCGLIIVSGGSDPLDLKEEETNKAMQNSHYEPDPDASSNYQDKFEPDPDDSSNYQNKIVSDPDDSCNYQNKFEPDPEDSSNHQNKHEPNPADSMESETLKSECKSRFNGSPVVQTDLRKEPDPDEVGNFPKNDIAGPDQFSQGMEILDAKICQRMVVNEPDPGDLGDKQNALECGHTIRPDEADNLDQTHLSTNCKTCDGDDSQGNGAMLIEPDPDDDLVHQVESSKMLVDEPDPDDQEIRRIQDSVALVCNRLHEAIAKLLAEVKPSESSAVFQTLFRIVKNVIEHPDEMKYRRLRKANPIIQKNVASYKAAMEILSLIGFIEDVLLDEIGKMETFLVLKRNDPGLLWLAKSTLETCSAF